jgi:hypothetical protein
MKQMITTAKVAFYFGLIQKRIESSCQYASMAFWPRGLGRTGPKGSIQAMKVPPNKSKPLNHPQQPDIFLLSNRQLENGIQSSSHFDMKKQSKAWNVLQQWPPSTSLAVHCQIVVYNISLSLKISVTP